MSPDASLSEQLILVMINLIFVFKYSPNTPISAAHSEADFAVT